MPSTDSGAPDPARIKLKEFFFMQLQELYWTEQKLIRTLPRLRHASTTPELQAAFEKHLQQTRNHMLRLQTVFSMIGEEARGQKCPVMASIAEEGTDLMDETEEGTAQRDIALIFAAQKAEHYEIAVYGSMAVLARTLGFPEASMLLAQTLEEELATDLLLTRIAEQNVHYRLSTEPATT